ncbi:MAG: hypothetical protein HYS38_07280 [Acidobacteria bacterium]|nr:hypothetical protein [Acidobacteriota bacterium]
MPDKTKAEIPYALLEYTAVFKKPIIEAWVIPGNLIAAVLNALEPWGFNLEGVEVKTHVEKLNEYGIVFRRSKPPAPNRSLALGLGKVVVTAENLDWTEAEQFIAGQSAALNAIRQTSRAEIQSQHLGLGMHIQLATKPRKDVTAPLLSPMAFKLLDGEVMFPGLILLREKSFIIIDASVAYANGLFVKIFRDHPPEATLEQLAEVLRKDEEQLFDVLGLEGIL